MVYKTQNFIKSKNVKQKVLKRGTSTDPEKQDSLNNNSLYFPIAYYPTTGKQRPSVFYVLYPEGKSEKGVSEKKKAKRV